MVHCVFVYSVVHEILLTSSSPTYIVQTLSQLSVRYISV